MQRFEDVLNAVLHHLASRNSTSEQQMLETRDDVLEVAIEQNAVLVAVLHGHAAVNDSHSANNAHADARVQCLNPTVDSLGDGFTGLRGHEGEEKRKKVRRPILLVGVSSKSQQNPENNGNYEL